MKLKATGRVLKGLPVYECDMCGACCRKLILEVNLGDALREPRIATEANLMDGRGAMPLVDACFSLNNQKGKGLGPCVFLGEDNKCGIYPTRPDVCVNHTAGSEQCQSARASSGLPRLQPSFATTEPTLVQRLEHLSRGEK